MVNLSEQLTIVIPNKDERWIILDCLNLLYRQKGIDGVNVIIADSSKDSFCKYILRNFTKKYFPVLNLTIIDGGYPSKARLEGSKLVKTPYVLFLDADIFLNDLELFNRIFETDIKKDPDLLTINIRTVHKWDWLYDVFNDVQKLFKMIGLPFAVGGFQLWKTETYWKFGGYNPEHLFAEDYAISQKVKSNKFIIHKTEKVWTLPRRFQKNGKWHMFKMLILSFINKNNPEFFKKDYNYWN